MLQTCCWREHPLENLRCAAFSPCFVYSRHWQHVLFFFAPFLIFQVLTILMPNKKSNKIMNVRGGGGRQDGSFDAARRKNHAENCFHSRDSLQPSHTTILTFLLARLSASSRLWRASSSSTGAMVVEAFVDDVARWRHIRTYMHMASRWVRAHVSVVEVMGHFHDGSRALFLRLFSQNFMALWPSLSCFLPSLLISC